MVEVDCHLAHLVIAEIILGRGDAILKKSTVRLVQIVDIIRDIFLTQVMLKLTLLLDAFNPVGVES